MLLVSVEIVKLTNDNSYLTKEKETLQANMEKVSQKAGNLVIIKFIIKNK